MSYLAIQQGFVNVNSQSVYDTESEAETAAESMLRQNPSEPVYVAQLLSTYSAQINISSTPATDSSNSGSSSSTGSTSS